jgi:uncharacterized protein YlaI
MFKVFLRIRSMRLSVFGFRTQNWYWSKMKPFFFCVRIPNTESMLIENETHFFLCSDSEHRVDAVPKWTTIFFLCSDSEHRIGIDRNETLFFSVRIPNTESTSIQKNMDTIFFCVRIPNTEFSYVNSKCSESEHCFSMFAIWTLISKGGEREGNISLDCRYMWVDYWPKWQKYAKKTVPKQEGKPIIGAIGSHSLLCIVPIFRMTPRRGQSCV